MEDDEEFDIDAFEKEIENWAKGVSQEARCAFASQCAARVLPNFGGAPRPVALTGFSFDVVVIRAMLTSAVAGTIPTADVKAAATSAYSATSATTSATYSTTSATTSAYSARSAAFSAAYSATSATTSAARSAARSARSAATSAYSARSAATSAYSARSAATSAYSARSAAEELNQSSPKALFEHPLWLGVTWPDAIANNWATLRGEWSSDPAMAFWIDWYEGLLAGRTPDWDLWHDIVLIDDELWKTGPEAVAREIEILQAARDLDGQIDRFEAQLLQLASEPVFEGNRDNGGPPIEDISIRLQTIELIKQQLEILKAERNKLDATNEDEPSPSIIRSALDEILTLLQSAFGLCWKMTKVGGTAMFVGYMGHIGVQAATNHPPLEAIQKSADGVLNSSQRLIDHLLARPPRNSDATSTAKTNKTIDL